MKSILSIALLVFASASRSGEQGPPAPATKPSAAAATRKLADDVGAGFKPHLPAVDRPAKGRFGSCRFPEAIPGHHLEMTLSLERKTRT